MSNLKPEDNVVDATIYTVADVDVYNDIIRLPGFFSFIRIKFRVYVMMGTMLAFAVEGHRFFTIDFDALKKFFNIKPVFKIE